METYNDHQLDNLQRKIPDKNYYDNFIGLAKKIAPDGQRVTRVGFTAKGTRGEKKVILLPRPSLKQPEKEQQALQILNQELKDEHIIIQGNLKYADARWKKNDIQVVQSDGSSKRIKVPTGMMADIVRPMFEYDVVIKAKKKGKSLIIEDIQLLSE